MIRSIALVVLFLFANPLAVAKERIPMPSAYHKISAQKQVPAELLYVISLQESQLTTNKGLVIPWPWSVNYRGKPYRFKSRRAMYIFCKKLTQMDELLFDVGIAQVNWRWHAERFNGDLWAATDPQTNLSVAATILRERYDLSGSWWHAAGEYHHPTNSTLAKKYKSAVYRKWTDLNSALSRKNQSGSAR